MRLLLEIKVKKQNDFITKTDKNIIDRYNKAKPVPAPRIKKEVIKPMPTPRTSVKQMVKEYEENIILPPIEFRDEENIIKPPVEFRDNYKPIPAPRTKKQQPVLGSSKNKR